LAEREVKLAFLGGGREVGRSALWVKGSGGSILLDYGVRPDDPEPSFPIHVPPRSLEAVVLTHAHLDHAGAAPLLYVNSTIPLYASQLTAETLELLLRDFLKLSGYYVPYEWGDVENMLRHLRPVKAGSRVRVGECWLSFYNSGHIPGGLQVLVEMDGKRLLYTGDVNTVETRLLKAADLIEEELDAIVMEATYAGANHPDRGKLEEEFVSSVLDVVEDGGRVLVPAFSVARAQEVMCILTSHAFEHPVFLDGMAKFVSQVYLRHPSSFRDFELLKMALRQANWVEGRRDRRKALRASGVIVTPAGMLKGGPAIEYAKQLVDEEGSSVFLVGYQIPGTPGRTLLEAGRLEINGKAQQVKAAVKRFDFSSHAGDDGLWRLLRSVKGSPKVFLVHGEEKACLDLAERARSELGLEAVAPSNGETFSL
jgi:putative mRNA 3-end processing factor